MLIGVTYLLLFSLFAALTARLLFVIHETALWFPVIVAFAVAMVVAVHHILKGFMIFTTKENRGKKLLNSILKAFCLFIATMAIVQILYLLGFTNSEAF